MEYLLEILNKGVWMGLDRTYGTILLLIHSIAFPADLVDIPG